MEGATQALDAHVALSACLGSAGAGALAIYQGAPNITLIASIAASAWFLAAVWLDRRRETGHGLQLVRVMKFGGALLMTMGLAVLFVP